MSGRLTPFDPAPRAVLFDLDDTLCDYASARDARLRRAFSLHLTGSESAWSDADLEAMVAESIRIHPHGTEHFAELFRLSGVADPHAAETAARWYRQNRFHGLMLFANAVALLRAVRSTPGPGGARRTLGIVTNGPADVQRAKIDLLGVGDLVDFAIISGEFGAAKPDRAIFTEALRLAGVAAHEAVFVGDSPEFDMAGAHAAGIPSVWLNTRGERWPASAYVPDRTIKDLGDVLTLIGAGKTSNVDSPA